MDDIEKQENIDSEMTKEPECPVVSPECPVLSPECPVVSPECTGGSPECPVVSPECTVVSSEYPVVSPALFCQPCSVGDKHEEVYGYCRDCCEFLCESCYVYYVYHTKLTICRHHVLQDKNSMPRDRQCETTKDRCIQRCLYHEEKLVKYFCIKHAQLGCSVCMILNHGKCDGVEHIPGVAKDFAEGQEYKDLNNRIETLMLSAQHVMHVARENVARSARFYSKALQNVNRLRQELVEALDQLEADVKKETEKLAKQDGEKLSAIFKKCENVLKELSELLLDFNDLQNKRQHSQLYIAVKSSVNDVTNFEKTLKALENKTVVNFNFQPSEEMANMLKTPEKLGKFFKWDLTEAGANHVKDIYVKTKTDKHTCCITGSVMTADDKLVIADRINDKLKVVDVRQGTLISEMELSSSPWDIAEIGDNLLAVTLPSEKRILVVKCNGGTLGKNREISVNSACWGIAFSKGKIVVTHEDPGSVDLYDMKGNLIQRFSTTEDGKELFKRPTYAAVADDLQTIYVADWENNSVTSLDFQGKIKQVYTNADLEYPGKLVVDSSGVVTVCGINSSNVHLISSDCTKIQIFSNTTELDHPRTVSYSEDNDILYVGMWENNNIRVYRLS